MPTVKAFLVLALWLASGLYSSAQKPSAAAACAHCHVAESRLQPDTQMAHAMQMPGSNPTLDAHPKLEFHLGKYTYKVETHAGMTQYTVTDGSQSLSLPVLWTMGAEAQTWVVERNGKMYESLVSYYPVLKGLDITTGDERLKPATLEEALGRAFGDEDAKACFGCHATNAVVDHKLNLTTLQPGLTCEHCHTGAMVHLSKIVHGDDSSIPRDLGNLTSEDMSNFCGQCHRTWDQIASNGPRGILNVRFQPYRLTNSRCYDAEDKRIACTACHDPHKEIDRVATTYDAKCQSCHAGGKPEAKACKVATKECSTCHMPKVELPGSHHMFSDHDIRIVRAKSGYPD